MKNTNRVKLYVLFLLGRRLLIIATLILLGGFSSITKIVMTSVLQLAYYGMLLVVRPFKCFRDNATECINETFFTVLTLWLLYFNSAEKWSKTTEKAYIWVMMANSMVVTVLLLG